MVVVLAVIGATCCVYGVGWCLVKVVKLFERVDVCEQNLDRLFEKKNEFICQFQRIEKQLHSLEMNLKRCDERLNNLDGPPEIKKP